MRNFLENINQNLNHRLRNATHNVLYSFSGRLLLLSFIEGR